jgi:hypothetical protein
MGYKYYTRYARKYKYDTFEFEIPEIVALFKEEAEKWAVDENKERLERFTKIQSDIDEDGKKKSNYKKKQDAQEIKDDWDDYYRPVIAEEYGTCGYGTEYVNIRVDKATGKFSFKFCNEMSVLDKLKGHNKKRNEKEAANGTKETTGV